MKKLVLGVALASLVISCKKIQAGSNHAVLKMEEGQEHYRNDEMKHENAPVKKAATSASDSAKTSGMKAAPAKVDSAKVVAPTTTAPALEKK